MPIKSPPRKVSETENMLRLLLCVDTLGSVTPTQLWTFVIEQELMDYVTMRLCLHKLLGAGELETGGGALGEQLMVTDRGREALRLFGTRLPGVVHDRVSVAAPEFRNRVLRNQQVRAAYESARPNDYRLNLTIYEGDLPTVRLHMETHNRALAGRTIHRFVPYASRVTTYLYGLAEQALHQPVENSQPLLPDAITEHSAAEFTARAAVEGKKARFIVDLLLPNRKAAEAFVRSLADATITVEVADRLAGLVSGSRRAVRK
ncbi:MAG: DUF4364 family protein [Eubacteriales bacterium]|nr:DUF4364 family protein [Eubacteriales bacterium]